MADKLTPPHGINSFTARDIATVLHPYTNLELHEKIGPLVITGGDGVHVIDDAGNRYIEAMSGLWCASLGFSEKRLADAGFHDRFAASTAGRLDTLSRDDFVVAKRLLAELGLSKTEIQDAALVFILRGSFCDADLAKERVPSLQAAEEDDD